MYKILAFFLLLINTTAYAQQSNEKMTIAFRQDTQAPIIFNNVSPHKIRWDALNSHLIKMHAQADSQSLDITLQSAGDNAFDVGTYDHVSNIGPSDIDSYLSLIISQSGPGLRDSFYVVKAVTYNNQREITSLALDFVTVEECTTPHVYMGAIRYNSLEPIDFDSYKKPFDQDNRIVLINELGQMTGQASNSSNYSYQMSLNSWGRKSIDLTYDGYHSISFGAPGHQALKAGQLYTNANNEQSNTSTHPWFLLDYTCKTNANFIIREMKLNQYHEVESFAADFATTCLSFDIPSFGAVRFHSRYPIEISTPSILNEKTGVLTSPLFSQHVSIDPTTYQNVTFESVAGKQKTFTVASIHSSNPNDLKSPILAATGNIDYSIVPNKVRLNLRIIHPDGRFGNYIAVLTPTTNANFAIGTEYTISNLTEMK